MFLKLRNIIYILACMIVVLAAGSFGAEPISKIGKISANSTDNSLSSVAPSTELTPLKSEIVSASALSADFANLKKQDKSIALASDFLVQKGFEAQTAGKNFFGLKETYSNTTRGGTQETVSLMVQDYRSKSSKDIGAVGRITVEEGNQKQDYTFTLIAPGGNFEKATEYQVASSQTTPTKLEVIPAHSMWSCFVQRIKDKCGTVCIKDLTQCPSGSWSQYLNCVLGCGVCSVKALACCACNSKGWCKWACGSCHQ
jgi:hypothetical protein